MSNTELSTATGHRPAEAMVASRPSREPLLPDPPTWLYGALLVAITAGSLFLRFHRLGEPALWLDEIIAVEKASQGLQARWFEWLLGLGWDLENGPLFYGLQLLARRVAEGEAAARLVPALFGALGVGLLGLAGTAVAGRWAGVVTTLLLATSPLHVYYSREGRPYSLVMFAACLLLLACLRKPSTGSLAAVYGACALAAYAGVFSGPLLASSGAAALAATLLTRRRPTGGRQRADRRRLGRHLMVAAAIGVALLGVLYFQAKRYKPRLDHKRAAAVASPISGVALERAVSSLAISGVEWASFEPRALAFFALALLGAVTVARRSARQGALIIGLAVLPVLFALATLMYLAHWYSIRYTSSGLPGLVLLAGIGLVALAALVRSGLSGALGRRGATTVGVAFAIGAGLLFVPANVDASRREPFYKVDWRHAAAILTRYGVDGETVVTSNHWTYRCLSFYLRDSRRRLQLVSGADSMPVGQRAAAESGACWLATAGFHPDGELRDWMRSFLPIWETDLEGLGLYYYPDFRSFVAARGASRDPGSLALEFVDEHSARLEFEASETLFTGPGWSQPETDGEDRTFRWAQGPSAELAVASTAAGDARIRFRALPFDFPGADPQTVELRLNDRRLGELTLTPDWHEYEILAPARVWRPGSNLLTLHFGRADRPADVLPEVGDQRPLAVAFDSLSVVPVVPTAPSQVALDPA